MKLSSLLTCLPRALLLSSLSFAVAAAPADSHGSDLTVLTPTTFEDSISNGVWLIESFSPYCGHCRKFLPTWTELAEEVQKQADPGIHLAQVNCATDGDLCTKNGVTGYPQLDLYKNGKYVETFKKARELDELREYIAAHAEPTAAPANRQVAATAQTPPADEPSEVHNPDGTVMVLDASNFDKALQDGHIFVKFYAPWCGHCKKLAPIWSQLALEMRGKLNIAEVDCERNSAICRTQGITGYPMLFYYGKRGHGKTEYTSNRKLEQLKAFAEKISGPAVQPISYEKFDADVRYHPALFLLLHPEADTSAMNLMQKASRALFGTPPVYSSSSEELYHRFNVNPTSSVVLALKDFDREIPAGVYHIDATTLSSDGALHDLSEWLVRNRLPMSMQLDSETFQDIMFAPHKPLVVITAAPKDKLVGASDRMRTVAQAWKDRRGEGADAVVFTWMDSEKWASWLKSMYGIKADSSAHVVIANHSRLVYYDVDQLGEPLKLSPGSLVSALEGAVAGTISYKHSENIVERLARFVNNQLVFVEHVVSNHPWAVSIMVVSVLAVLVLYFRRLWNQEAGYADELSRKARLD